MTIAGERNAFPWPISDPNASKYILRFPFPEVLETSLCLVMLSLGIKLKVVEARLKFPCKEGLDPSILSTDVNLSFHQMLTMENAEEYIQLVKQFCLYTGVQQQLDAFRGIT